MSFLARLHIDRPDRMPLDRAATLRGLPAQPDPADPIDVIVENLSTSGALIRSGRPLPVEATVSLGLAGVGRRLARVSRADAPFYGLAFDEPIGEAEIAAAPHAQTVVDGNFPPLPIFEEEAEALVETSYPVRTRAMIVASATIACWAAIALFALLLLKA